MPDETLTHDKKTDRGFDQLIKGINRPLGYLAGPISSDPEGHTGNAAIIAREISEACGVELIVPHACTVLDKTAPRSYADWMRLDGACIARADFVFRIPGTSPGADAEERLAYRLDIPIFRDIEKLRAWAHRREIGLHTYWPDLDSE